MTAHIVGAIRPSPIIVSQFNELLTEPWGEQREPVHIRARLRQEEATSWIRGKQ